MNRRSFLKSLTIVCGAAVVCPGELLKGKTEHEILLEKFRAAALNTKYKNGNPIFIKARQQGMTTIIFDEFATQRDKMYFAYRGQYYNEKN